MRLRPTDARLSIFPARGTGFTALGCTAATVHLAAAAANFSWLEVRISPTETLNFQDPDWFPLQIQQDEYRLLVPDAPGLGIEFNEERAKKAELQLWEAPHLRRRDGSYTNW